MWVSHTALLWREEGGNQLPMLPPLFDLNLKPFLCTSSAPVVLLPPIFGLTYKSVSLGMRPIEELHK